MDTMSGRLAVAALIITFILCYNRLYLNAKSGKKRFAERAEAAGYVTEGVYVEGKHGAYYSEYLKRKDNVYTASIVYEYHVEGKAYQKTVKFSSRYWDFQTPVRILVYYDPQNPKKVVTDCDITTEAQRRGGCLPTIILPIVAFQVVRVLFQWLD